MIASIDSRMQPLIIGILDRIMFLELEHAADCTNGNLSVRPGGECVSGRVWR